MIDKSYLVPETKINDNFYAIQFVDFHASLEKIENEVDMYNALKIEEIIKYLPPQKDSWLIPACPSVPYHNKRKIDYWFVLTKINDISFKVTYMERNSLINTRHGSGFIALRKSYEESCVPVIP